MTGDKVEEYTLKVVYTPDYTVLPRGQGGTYAEDIHTGTFGTMYQGHAAGTETSENKHVINVYAEPLDILKVDEYGNKVQEAKFKLYRTAKEGESVDSQASDYGLPSGDYYCISTATSGNDGIAHLAPEDISTPTHTIPVADGQTAQNLLVPGETYYLVESSAPTEEAQPVADADAADAETADAEKAEPAGSAVERSLTAEAAYARFFDIEIWDGEQKIEPAAPVTVSIRLLDAPQESDAVPAVVHFAEAGLDVMDASLTTGTAPEGTAETEFKFRTETFSVYGVVYTIVIETRVMTASGETFIISVSFNQDAGIPENATLEAKEILEGTEEYARYLEKSRMALIQRGTEKAAPADGSEPADTTEPADETEPSAETPAAAEANPEVEEAQTADTDAPEDKEGVTLRALADTAQDIVSARFFDLAILADGEKVEPRAPVSVKIRYAEPVELDVSALHTEAGSANVYPLHIHGYGEYAVTVEASTETGDVSQTTMTMYDSGTVKGSMTLIGGNGEHVTRELRFDGYGMMYPYLNFYFAQSGMTVHRIVVEHRGKQAR